MGDNNSTSAAPQEPRMALRYADIGVTASADAFRGFYRGKQYHEPDFPATLDRARAAGVERILLTGMSLDDVELNEELSVSRSGLCFYTIGIHPYHAAIPESGLEAHMQRLNTKVIDALNTTPRHLSAFGELGLDYDRLEHASKEDQKRVFIAQLEFAKREQYPLPLFLHCRAAFEDFVEILTPYLPHLPQKGVVHSFVGSAAEMQRLVGLGLHISVNGFSFRDSTTLEMVAAIPLDHLHFETDAPWGEIKLSSPLVKQYCGKLSAAPPSRKKEKWDSESMVKERNESCNIGVVACIVAGLKGITVEEVADAAWRNSTNLFAF